MKLNTYLHILYNSIKCKTNKFLAEIEFWLLCTQQSMSCRQKHQLSQPGRGHSPTWSAELGPLDSCCDNVTMFSGQKLLLLAAWLYSLCLLHLDTEAFTCFVFLLVIEALTRCRVVVVAKLKHCHIAQLWLVGILHRKQIIEHGGHSERPQKFAADCQQEWMHRNASECTSIPEKEGGGGDASAHYTYGS